MSIAGRFAAVERAIDEAERRTSAELVVAVANQAAPYQEPRWALGTLAAFSAMAFFLIAPWFTVTQFEALLSAFVAGGIGFATPGLVPSLRRQLVQASAIDRHGSASPWIYSSSG